MPTGNTTNLTMPSTGSAEAHVTLSGSNVRPTTKVQFYLEGHGGQDRLWSPVLDRSEEHTSELQSRI